MEGGGVVNEENGELHPLPLQVLQQEQQQQQQPPPHPSWKIVAVAAIGVGLQFGWALQCSLLIPYVQLLGIPHKWASLIWLCGPICGMVVQPLAGYYSDRCTSRFGRRRPFIAVATTLVAVAVILIGFAADLGRLSGDPLGHRAKPRAISIFVVGFWVLDVANNMLMAPCRALLADLSGDNQRKTRNANAAYSFFTAVGNVLGFTAGSYSGLHNLFPFSSTQACDVFCANLKTCFLISVSLLLTLNILALSTVREHPISKPEREGEREPKTVPFFGELFSALKDFPKSMWILLLVACLNSTAGFAFLLYDTDWMGREVYGGVAGEKLYDRGVRAGSLGLMLNSAVGGVTAVAVMLVARGVKSGNRLWGCANILLAVCLATTVWITKAAQSTRRHVTASGGGGGNPDPGVKAAALALFAVLGIPSALIVSLTSGPLDELFGGGNLPSFVVGAVAAIMSGVLALTLLPSRSSQEESATPVLKISAATAH